MASSFSNSINTLAEEIHKFKFKYGHDDKKCELVELNTKIANTALNMQKSKMI